MWRDVCIRIAQGRGSNYREFTSDTQDKQDGATDAIRQWAAAYLTPLSHRMAAYNAARPLNTADMDFSSLE